MFPIQLHICSHTIAVRKIGFMQIPGRFKMTPVSFTSLTVGEIARVFVKATIRQQVEDAVELKIATKWRWKQHQNTFLYV